MAKKNKINNNTLSSELSPKSIDFLGLSKQPFASEILSDASFFRVPALDKITENLTHHIQFSDLLLIIEGLQGSGKTSLFRILIQSNIQNIKLLSIQAEATDTLVQIQQKMSLHLQDMGDANHLDDNLKSLQMFDQTPLVIVDNSHVLSDTTLQEFLRYQQQLKSEHEVTLKILLFANAGMANTLQNISDIEPERMYVQFMPEYSTAQIKDFITHRLKSAGYNGEPLLNNDDIDVLLKKTNGTPASIMSHAAPMLEKIIDELENPPTSQLIKILIAFFILAIIGAGAFTYLYVPDESDAPSDTVDKPLPETNPAEIFVADTEENSSSDMPDSIEVPVEQPMQLEVIPPDEFSADNNQTEKTDNNTSGIAAPVQNEPEVIIDETIVDKSIVTEQTTSPELTPQLPQEIKDTKNDTPQPVEPVTISAPVPVKEKIIKKPVVVTKKTAAIKPPSTRLHPSLQQLNDLGTNNSSWIKQQASSAWTMQVLGAREPGTLLKFARKHRLGSKLAWYKTMLKGKPYYVLILGSYPGRDSARASIAKQSKQIRALKPWVKSMKSVQQAIK